MSLKQQDQIRSPRPDAAQKPKATDVDIQDLKVIDLDSAQLPSSARSRHSVTQMRDRLKKGGNAALFVSFPSGPAALDLSNMEYRSTVSGILRGERVGPSTVSLERLSGLLGQSSLSILDPENIHVAQGKDGLRVNGRGQNPLLISEEQLAVYQPPLAPDQNTDTEQQGNPGKQEFDLKAATAELFSKFQDLSKEDLSKTFEGIAQSTDPADKERIGVFVDNPRYQRGELVAGTIVLVPFTVTGEKNAGAYEIEAPKNAELSKEDISYARKALGVSEEFPLDAKFDIELKGKSVQVKPEGAGFRFSDGLTFHVNRRIDKIAQPTLGVLKRPAAEVKSSETKE